MAKRNKKGKFKGKLKKMERTEIAKKNSDNNMYRKVAEILDCMDERKISFAEAFTIASPHRSVSQIYAVCSRVLDNLLLCDDIINKADLLKENGNKFKNLLRAIIADFLGGRENSLDIAGELGELLQSKKDLLMELKQESDKMKEINFGPIFFRVNTLKYTVDNFLKYLESKDFKLIETPSNYDTFLQAINELEPTAFMIDYHFKDLFVFAKNSQQIIKRFEIYDNKSIMVQDKPGLIGVHLLGIEPGNTVLDMCAAPGIKAVLMAPYLQGKGNIIAVDTASNGYKALLKKVRSSGIANLVKCFCEDITKFDYTSPDSIDLVLLHPHCYDPRKGQRQRIGQEADSTDNSKDRMWSELPALLLKMLTNALTAYPNAKRVVYSTTTIDHEQNEAVVQGVINNLGENMSFKLMDCHKMIEGYLKGSSDYDCGSFCLKVDPVKELSKGYFVALFERPEKNLKRNISSVETDEIPETEDSIKRIKTTGTDDEPTSPKADPSQTN